jgi:hypothetical protein
MFNKKPCVVKQETREKRSEMKLRMWVEARTCRAIQALEGFKRQ